jgi:2-polyprenyl-6-methoxyphenol hydroxylase-like FAD-dependent oxidoreductase
VGDAGYCVSPLAGFGGSMAIIGAGRLASALEQHPGDHATAFRHYEDGLRSFVEDVQQRAASDGMSMMCPADEAELTERDQKIAAGDVGL